jgi:hypothetical protein
MALTTVGDDAVVPLGTTLTLLAWPLVLYA